MGYGRWVFIFTVDAFLMRSFRRPNAYSVAEMGRSLKRRATPSMDMDGQWGHVTGESIL